MSVGRRARVAIVVLGASAALGGMAAIAIGAANGTTTIRAGNLVLQAEGVFSPKALPRHTWAPITLNGHGSVATADGSHVPPVQSVHLQVDKHLRIESTGLPSCPLGKIEATTPSQAMKACGAALIGKGHATAEVAFPESAPFSAKGALLGFNGPTVRGYPEMLFYVNVAVPVPTTIVVVAQLAKDSGRYGYKISMAVPELAGGSGSLTGFELTIGRQWTYKGARHSYLSAQCPEGQFVNQVEAAFGDGTTLTGTLVSSCRPKG